MSWSEVELDVVGHAGTAAQRLADVTLAHARPAGQGHVLAALDGASGEREICKGVQVESVPATEWTPGPYADLAQG